VPYQGQPSSPSYQGQPSAPPYPNQPSGPPYQGQPYPGQLPSQPYPGQPANPAYQHPQHPAPGQPAPYQAPGRPAPYQPPPQPQYPPPGYQQPSPYGSPTTAMPATSMATTSMAATSTAPKKRSGGAPIALIVGVGALIVVVVAIVAVTALRSGGSGKNNTSVAAGSPSDGKIDKCLVGKWTQTDYQKNVPLADTEVGKREKLGTIKFAGRGKTWTIQEDGSATEDDSKTVYTGKTDDGHIVTATYEGTTTWKLTTGDRKIYYAGIKSDAVITIAVDGRDAGRIRLEPNTDPVNYTCVNDVWRTTNPADLDSWNTYERQ
jgi:hypothetical protein